jgi:hypothetical protein
MKNPSQPLLGLSALAVATTISLQPLPIQAADLEKARDGSGVYGYRDTPVLPWCGFRVHDPDRPNPPRIQPGPHCPMPAPSDARVLFGGNDLEAWLPTSWQIQDGDLVAIGNSTLTTREEFGAYQLHLEWLAPDPPAPEWYNRGNNGVLLMGLYEIQIFDSYTEQIYPDGMAAAIYGQTPPRVNATRKPGEWQSYDLVFLPPRFDGDRLVEPARITLFHNGVLVHLQEPIRGETGHRILPEYRQKRSRGPLALHGHDCPVRFRNIWLRPLD